MFVYSLDAHTHTHTHTQLAHFYIYRQRKNVFIQEMKEVCDEKEGLPTVHSGKNNHNFITTRRIIINPLVPDDHFSEPQDKPFSLQIQRLEVDIKLNC